MSMTTGHSRVCGVGLNSSLSLFPSSISICNASSVPHLPSPGKRLLFTIRAKANNGAFPTDRSMDRQKALEVAMNDINSCFGKGSVTRLGSAGGALVETFPSGCLTLDLALGGGLPKGRIVEVYGPESSGKTTLALHAIAEIQKLGGNAMLVDAEHVFDPYYSKALGVDVESLIVCQPDSGEMALETADRMCRSGAVDLICIDSVAALTPRAEIEGEIGMMQIGLQARLMSQALRKMSGNASKAGCTLIFLNQIRHKVGVFYGSPEVTSGGIALKFFASLRLEIRSAGKIKSLKGDEDIGVRTRIRVQKSKVSRPYKQAEFDIIFGEGVNRLGCILDCSEMLDIVSKKGSWYSYGDIRLGQGRDRALQYLQETPLHCIEIEKVVSISIWSFNCGIFIKMSNTNRGKKTSRQRDVLSFFQKPQSMNPHFIHPSSSVEQTISERDSKSREDASDIHIIDGNMGSSSGQSETNVFSSEIGDKTIEDFSMEDEIIHSRKRKKGQWDIGRLFQPEWVSKFPFIEPILPANEKETSREVKCIVCSWKLRKVVKLQMKLDTIEKHAGKVYEKKIVNGEEKTIIRWKPAEDCRHVKYEDEYNKFLVSKGKLEASGGTIISLFGKTMERNLLSKTIQLSTVFQILSSGRPMTDYPNYMKYLSFLQVSNFPSSHWSVTSGWEWAKYLARVEKDDLKEKIANSRFLSLSLDEVTAIDNTSWICMSIYMVNGHVRHSYLLGIHKMSDSSTAENIYGLVISSLKEISGMDNLMIAKKLVCVGADGASVMQGQRNGLCVKLQLSASPYMLSIHCMAHRMNLAFKIVSKFPLVSKVEALVREVHAYFCRSPKRFLEFQKFADGVTNGKKLLKDVDTRWISLKGPAQRLFSEYESLVGVMYEHRFSVDKAQDILFRLTDIETLLTLAGVLPMLHEMNVLVKVSQNRTMYIAEYTTARKLACLALDNLYTMEDSFTRPEFTSWTRIVNIENVENYLKFDEKGMLCMAVRGYMVPFHYIGKIGRTTKECPVSREQFDNIIISVKRNLIEIAKSLASEIRERFPRDELLEAMSIVYPQYWNNCQCQDTLKDDFIAKVKILDSHFCKETEIHGKRIQGILDHKKLGAQAECFANTMRRQFSSLKNPLEFGAITRLWSNISYSDYLQEHMSEYFKLADLCQTMILGSVEDERMFSALSFLKSKLRNKLEKNMDTCLRLYVTKYDVNNFPYERALAHWRSDCERRGENNITNFSIDELDMENNVFEAHNDGPSKEDHVQSVENEDQYENWEIDISQDDAIHVN